MAQRHSQEEEKMDFSAVPHAVFTYPQIASIGLTEEQAKKEYDVLVGKGKYSDTVMGSAMMEVEGLRKRWWRRTQERSLGSISWAPALLCSFRKW
jgi:dihydrolipoamide dehydrogenase